MGFGERVPAGPRAGLQRDPASRALAGPRVGLRWGGRIRRAGLQQGDERGRRARRSGW
jgi:hypothetical protein